MTKQEYTADLLSKTIDRLASTWVSRNSIEDYTPLQQLLLGCPRNCGSFKWNLQNEVRLLPLPNGQRAPLLEAMIRWYHMNHGTTKILKPRELIKGSVNTKTTNTIQRPTATSEEVMSFARATDFSSPVFFMGGRYNYFNAPIVMAMFETAYKSKISIDIALGMKPKNTHVIESVLAGGKFKKPKDIQKELQREHDVSTLREQFSYKL